MVPSGSREPKNAKHQGLKPSGSEAQSSGPHARVFMTSTQVSQALADDALADAERYQKNH